MNNKSFTDRLRERREFVESTNELGGAMQRLGRGGGNPGVAAPPDMATIMAQMVQGDPTMSKYLQDRNAYNTDSQNQLGSQVASQINNGVDGSAINPVAALGVLKDLYTNNQNSSNSLFQMLSQGAQQSAANTIDAQKASNEYGLGLGNLSLGQQAQNLQNYQSGYNPSNTGSISPLVQQTGDNIIKGLTSLDKVNVPQNVKNQIQQYLDTKGYDPAAQFTTALSQLQKAYGSGGTSIAAGGNPVKSTVDKLGLFLNNHTGGAVKFGDINNINNYDTLREGLKGRGGIWDTIYSQLPTSQDTPDLALKKFKNVQDTINSRFYPAGKPGSKAPKGNTDPLGILK